jgi:drug/metabolite transporter (DMT)-like permease
MPGEPPRRDSLWTATTVGVISFVGYGLVLFAYNHAPLTAVAPLRESAVVFASGWGTLRLGEGGSRMEAVWRIGGAAVVVAGIFLLALDGG